MKITEGCPFCKGPGDCYGQCDARFKAMTEAIIKPLRKLQRDIKKAFRKRRAIDAAIRSERRRKP